MFCFVFHPSISIIIFASEKHSKSLDKATANAPVDNAQCLGAEMTQMTLLGAIVSPGVSRAQFLQTEGVKETSVGTKGCSSSPLIPAQRGYHLII